MRNEPLRDNIHRKGGRPLYVAAGKIGWWEPVSEGYVMEASKNLRTGSESQTVFSNAEIADRLASLAQLLSTQKENPYKVKAYSRAAARIRDLSKSRDEMVRRDEDLTQFPGIGGAIASAIREIVTTGALGKLEKLRADVDPVLLEISQYSRLDPKRVMRVYKKLGISTIEELRARLKNGEVEKLFGPRMGRRPFSHELGLTRDISVSKWIVKRRCGK
jgi:hypothetical protein